MEYIYLADIISAIRNESGYHMILTERLDRVFEAAKQFGCEVRREPSLKSYTSFKIGGCCDGVIVLSDEKACRELPRLCRELEIPYYIFGKGSNLIVSDEKIDGIVFVFGEGLSQIRFDGCRVAAGAGASFTGLSAAVMREGLSGLEFAYGIPGSVGGAVYMNAGAYGGETADVIVKVRAVLPDGSIAEYSRDELEMSYRKSRFSGGDSIILSAEFELTKGDVSEIKAKMDDLMERRRSKQPLEYPSAGSTFKRPEGSFASLLIDQCGLKGRSVGDAQVSEKHAGFIVNKGNATFDNLMSLIKIVQDEVYEKTGYKLECEPVIIR